MYVHILLVREFGQTLRLFRIFLPSSYFIIYFSLYFFSHSALIVADFPLAIRIGKDKISVFYLKLLVTAGLQNYWSRDDLCSFSPGVIVALQKEYMNHIMKLVLTR